MGPNFLIPQKIRILLSSIFFILVFTPHLIAQSVNDYRSINSGNWTSPLIWEVYNGTIWVPATSYPGQNAGTNDISIEGGNSITLSSNIPNSFNSLTIGDGLAATDVLLVAGISTLNTMLITIANGGFGSWISNVSLYIPAGAAFIVEPLGSLDISNPCSAAKRIVIGTVIYSSCNGGAGATYSFSDLNNNGGSLNVSPSSNEPICEGQILNLFSNVAGSGSSSATFNWSATGPGGYTYSSTLSNPSISNLISGSYIFTVEATSGSITHSGSKIVSISNSPDIPISGGDTTICNNATIPALMASVNSGETIDWYDSASSGVLLLSGSTNYLPTSSGSFFAEARNSVTGCLSISRIEIVLNTKTCKAMINRHIPRFIKKI